MPHHQFRLLKFKLLVGKQILVGKLPKLSLTTHHLCRIGTSAIFSLLTVGAKPCQNSQVLHSEWIVIRSESKANPLVIGKTNQLYDSPNVTIVILSPEKVTTNLNDLMQSF